MNIAGNARIALELLSEHKECYGLELVERSEGAIKKGSVYWLLVRLGEAGYVKLVWHAAQPGRPGIPKSHYTLTEDGRRALANAKREWARHEGDRAARGARPGE